MIRRQNVVLGHKTLTTFHGLQRNPRQQHTQFCRVDRYHRFAAAIRNCFEAAGFQPLVPKSKTSDFPVQNPDAISTSIDEQKQTSVIRLTIKLAAN